jgi:aspartyl-tRNA(Asn)/glutamyl-tRNA(Gln) amidotransferase subunit A
VSEPWRLSVTDLGRVYRSGECTPLDAVESCLARIAQVDGETGAFTLVLHDRARADAEALGRELRAGTDRGPLHGIPFAVKDLFDVEGTVTTAGSNVPVGGERRAARDDAPVVERLRRAGAIVVGRTRTHEYAWGITTRHADGTGAANPWDTSRITGGSSGGSAAAVAAGCVPVALGTDTGGSIRIPAAFCGTVGWKPAYGTLPLDGVVPLAPSLDHVGVLARTVEDAALVHAAAAGTEPSPWAPAAASGLRLGVLEDPALPRPAPSVEAAIDAVVRALGEGGARVTAAGPGGGHRPFDVFGPIQMREALHVHTTLLGTWPGSAASYGPDVAGRLRRAGEVTGAVVAEASAAREEIRRALAASLAGLDAVLSPVTPCAPPAVADPDHVLLGGERMPLRDAVMPFNVAANLAGLPAAAVPAGLDDDGLPVSVQVMGTDEVTVLRVAGAIQRIAGAAGFPGETRMEGP